VSIAPRLIWPVEALLGEGPAWFPGEETLRFVDIKQGLVHRYHPETGASQTWHIGGKPSFIVAEEGGGLLVGSGNVVLKLGSQCAAIAPPLASLPQPEHNRTNDATVDMRGRLWLGTMDDDEQQATGALWCLDRGTLHRIGGEAVVTNGPAIGHDGRTLYHVDSGARTIWRFTIGANEAGAPVIERREVFLQLTPADGHPDGVVLDSEDCLWVALWDGWGVRRYAPDGTLLLHIPFPCARVTKIAFGGSDLTTAYVTTARIGLDAAALAAQPLAGGLFAFDAPVPGRVLPPVRL
jgi:D-xylonolactonase